MLSRSPQRPGSIIGAAISKTRPLWGAFRGVRLGSGLEAAVFAQAGGVAVAAGIGRWTVRIGHVWPAGLVVTNSGDVYDRRMSEDRRR